MGVRCTYCGDEIKGEAVKRGGSVLHQECSVVTVKKTCKRCGGIFTTDRLGHNEYCETCRRIRDREWRRNYELAKLQ